MLKIQKFLGLVALLMVVTVGSVAATPRYFQVVAKDTRRCAFPWCGGYFIKDGEADLTECLDGKPRSSCYVSELMAKDRQLDEKLNKVLANSRLLKSILLEGDIIARDHSLVPSAVLVVRDMIRP